MGEKPRWEAAMTILERKPLGSDLWQADGAILSRLDVGRSWRNCAKGFPSRRHRVSPLLLLGLGVILGLLGGKLPLDRLGLGPRH